MKDFPYSLCYREQNLRQCENMVYAGSTTKDGQPVLTPPAILDGITQLDRVLEDLTQSIMSLMGEYNNKLKVRDIFCAKLWSEQNHIMIFIIRVNTRYKEIWYNKLFSLVPIN